MQGNTSPRNDNVLYRNLVLQFKILRLLFLFICGMAMFKGLHFQEVITATEIILCYNTSLEGFRLNAPVLEVRNVSWRSACVDLCFSHPCCRSMNYNHATSANQTDRCELLLGLVENTSYILEANPSFHHFFFNQPQKEYNSSCIPEESERHENKTITNITRNCSCLNNGSCFVNASEGYSCKCQLGYFGPRCETHACSLSPCENGGICQVNGSTGLHCTCLPGYSGTLCENSICSSSKCLHGGSCVVNGSDGYHCKCQPGYNGTHCEIDVCLSSPCKNGTTCVVDRSGGYVCNCPLGYSGTDCKTEKQTETYISCKDIFDNNSSAPNGVYYLKSSKSSEIYPVYCHMSSLSNCGGGGWTLVMKFDKDEATFGYNSVLWTNDETLHVEAGLEGLTRNEAKLASYDNTPFTKICLGMSEKEATNWILVNHTAESLYSVIANGSYTHFASNAGRAEWMSLINDASLQQHCSREGFNVQFSHRHLKLRIGIAGNNEHNCDSCDSAIGFGIEIKNTIFLMTTNFKWSSGNLNFQIFQNRKVKTFGYILVM